MAVPTWAVPRTHLAGAGGGLTRPFVLSIHHTSQIRAILRHLVGQMRGVRTHKQLRAVSHFFKETMTLQIYGRVCEPHTELTENCSMSLFLKKWFFFFYRLGGRGGTRHDDQWFSKRKGSQFFLHAPVLLDVLVGAFQLISFRSPTTRERRC